MLTVRTLATRVTMTVLGAVTVLGAMLALAAPAAAHNQLVSSDPADGDRVEQAPERITLTFLSTLDAENANLDVTGPDGDSVTDGVPEVDENAVTVPVLAPLPGDYQVEYEVLSSDGHWVEGALEFTVTEGDPQAVAEPTPAQPSPSPRPSPTSQATEPADDLTETGIAEESSSGSVWWIWPVLAVLVLGGGFAGYRLARRRRSGEPG